MMEFVTRLINSYFPEPHASLVNGIILGRPLFVTEEFYNQLKTVGLIHIVVLSGMNITMLSAIVMNTIVTFVGRKLSSIVTIFIIIIFISFVGAEAPVVRAGVMGILAIFGLMLGRKTITIWLLFLSGFLMILINHAWLTSVSFQLSFSATLGIILFGKIEEPVEKKGQKTESKYIKVLLNYFKEELRISLAAQIFTLPIIFWYFRQISFISPIANILVAWTIAPIMILGIITIAIGSINWHAGFIFSWTVYPLTSFLVKTVEILSKIPFSSIKI